MSKSSDKSFELIRPGTVQDVPQAPLRLERPSSSSSSPFGGYDLSSELAISVNVALTLGQPLLVTGEPGCGKTSLAWAVARQLGCEVHEFHTRSTSTARDLLYTIDTLRRFHDAQAKLDESRDAARYLEYQALGRAIRADHTCVVLIDEIDKAPRDFPNDLLHELDRMEFSVPETTPTQHHRATHRHFVLITSNSERRLPGPFLRRCVYAHVDFPAEEQLRRILNLHLGDAPPALLQTAARRFLALRARGDLQKPPATSELLAWTRALHHMGVSPDVLDKANDKDLPALGALVKMAEDAALLGAMGRTRG
ncbi:MAG: MoxR family ATPase [Deltaproteobacteria bacterium]|nr:MoxR family ATPase [Deltaproteobacteria bacterium]